QHFAAVEATNLEGQSNRVTLLSNQSLDAGSPVHRPHSGEQAIQGRLASREESFKSFLQVSTRDRREGIAIVTIEIPSSRLWEFVGEANPWDALLDRLRRSDLQAVLTSAWTPPSPHDN